MSLEQEVKRGSAELAILAVLSRAHLHGYEIARQIEQQSGGTLSFDMASLYPMLYRLERQGFLKGQWETVPNGRRRRCYQLTAEGKKRLQPLRKQWRMFFEALDSLAGVSHA
jgi:PadR family transcriptional regulator, regulatory protein PadR